VGHSFLSVGDEDTPCGKILAEEAEPFDGSFDFPLVYVSTSTVNSIIVESLDGLRRETFLLDGTPLHHQGQPTSSQNSQNGCLRFMAEPVPLISARHLRAGSKRDDKGGRCCAMYTPCLPFLTVRKN
jgi:hypothetical protein